MVERSKRPLAGLDANLLVVLDALLETESVAVAAKQLGLSASAVSHALSRLRTVMGDPILVRAGKKMTITTRARAIAPTLREGLAMIATAVVGTKAQQATFSPAEEKRELRMGAIDFAINQVVPDLLQVLRREAPGVDVVVKQFDARSLDDLIAGELNLVIGLHRVQTQVRHAALLREPFVCLVRRGHPALNERMTPKRFAALPHALVSSSARRRGSTDASLEKLGLSRRITLVMPTFMSAAMAVAESDMVLTGSQREAARAMKQLSPSLVSFDVPVDVAPFSVSMFWHERDHRDPFMMWLRNRLPVIVNP
jgi:DNA-binding transcriptional LysR family regulator